MDGSLQNSLETQSKVASQLSLPDQDAKLQHGPSQTQLNSSASLSTDVTVNLHSQHNHLVPQPEDHNSAVEIQQVFLPNSDDTDPNKGTRISSAKKLLPSLVVLDQEYTKNGDLFILNDKLSNRVNVCTFNQISDDRQTSLPSGIYSPKHKDEVRQHSFVVTQQDAKAITEPVAAAHINQNLSYLMSNPNISFSEIEQWNSSKQLFHLLLPFQMVWNQERTKLTFVGKNRPPDDDPALTRYLQIGSESGHEYQLYHSSCDSKTFLSASSSVDPAILDYEMQVSDENDQNSPAQIPSSLSLGTLQNS